MKLRQRHICVAVGTVGLSVFASLFGQAQASSNLPKVMCQADAAASTGAGVSSGLWEIGAHSSPPKGPGPGELVAWKVGTRQTCTIAFGAPHTLSGNSFYIAYDKAAKRLYVPTLAGYTQVLDVRTFTSLGRFPSPPGARVARVSPKHDVLIEMSSQKTAAYTLPGYTKLYELAHGGNAVVFSPNGRHAYIGGNMNTDLIEVSTSTGKVENVYPISHTGDLAYADGKVFSVDMKSGVMSVLYPKTGKILRIKTPEIDPNFSYRRIPNATAGFMQIAIDAKRHRLYVAGFSGHILKFSTSNPGYLGEIKVSGAPSGQPNKLSGLAIVDTGRAALTTVENLKTAVVVRLSDGKIIRRMPGTSSNRWVNVVLPDSKTNQP